MNTDNAGKITEFRDYDPSAPPRFNEWVRVQGIRGIQEKDSRDSLALPLILSLLLIASVAAAILLTRNSKPVHNKAQTGSTTKASAQMVPGGTAGHRQNPAKIFRRGVFWLVSH